ncbi:MAG: DUF1588 domain-containing protein [Myxococcaceae bacterium]|nr:DUF1588 domain-containing protein [Myxococcaceae bacterium]
MRCSRLVGLACCVVLVDACDGQISLPSPTGPTEPPGPVTPGDPVTPGELPPLPDGGLPPDINPFACDAAEPASELNAKRLARVEYVNAVRSLLLRALGPTDTAALMTQLQLPGRLPAESSSGYSTSDTNFSVLHANEYFQIADALATALGTGTSYARFVTTYVGYAPGTCTLGSPDTLSDACEDALLRNFLLRAWGRPAEEGAANQNDELAAFRREFALAPNSRAGVEAMVVRALISPQFLFHLQTDLRSPAGDQHVLSSHAIARRLAYTFTQSPPSEALLALAATRDLADDAAFDEALALVSPSAAVSQFTGEWLHVDELPTFSDPTHPKSIRVRQGITANDALRDAMRDEAVELVRWVSESGGTLRDVLTSDVSFARSPDLMHIYGQLVPAPAQVTAANAVRFPPGQRSGLLTRAAMLMAGGHTENPILRSIHIRRYLLCLPTPQPVNLPANALAPPLPDATLTTRERYHQKTSVQPCQGCHAIINPLGFALSKYDALGAFQDSEPAYDANWSYAGQLPTDATANLRASINVDVDVSSGVELGEVVANTRALRTCLTRNFYTYVNGLQELPVAAASCEMSRMYQSLSDGAPLQRFFQASVTDPRFRRRTLRSTP